uniref:Uncharacterized protein n=1 Tax=Octopus bimaculoides TaxID=37653 RepID=A0A0L8G7F6_OCTBM
MRPSKKEKEWRNKRSEAAVGAIKYEKKKRYKKNGGRVRKKVKNIKVEQKKPRPDRGKYRREGERRSKEEERRRRRRREEEEDDDDDDDNNDDDCSIDYLTLVFGRRLRYDDGRSSSRHRRFST